MGTASDGLADHSRSPQRRYAKGEARREAIIVAAVEVFGRTGYEHGSMREIARRAGLTQPGLLHHFANKEELFAEVLSRRDETVRDAAGEPESGVIEQAQRVVAHNQTARGLSSLFAIVAAEASDVDHPLHADMAERYRSYADRATTLLREGQITGDIRSDIDAELGGRLISAVMDGLQVQRLLDESVNMVELFDEFVRGYFRPPLDAPS